MSCKSCSQNLCNSTRAKAAVQILLLEVITQCKAGATAGMSLQNFGGNVQLQIFVIVPIQPVATPNVVRLDASNKGSNKKWYFYGIFLK